MFITPRERTLLKTIERATRQPIKPMDLPTLQAVNDVRIARFKDQITETLAAGGLEQFQSLVADYEREHDVPASEIAAALAMMARGNSPLLLDKKAEKGWHEDGRPAAPQREERGARPDRGDRGDRAERPERAERPAYPKKERIAREPEPGMATYRIEVGYEDGVKPGNIVGAIANEGGVDSKFIGRIEIFEDYTVLDMPADLPADVLDTLTQVRVAGRPMRIRRDGEPAAGPAAAQPAPKAAAPKPAASKAVPPTAVTPKVEREAAPRGLDAVVAEAVTEEEAPKKKKRERAQDGLAMRAYRIEVGTKHEATPSNIVGAIANESGLEARYIGRIEIFEDHTVLEMPDGMPDEIFKHLGKVWVGGQQLKISKADAMPPLSGKHTPPKKPVAKPKTKR
jgi:ATP-dependent RNA helicase DeaD